MVLACWDAAGGGVWGGKKACTFISGLNLWRNRNWGMESSAEWEWGNGIVERDWSRVWNGNGIVERDWSGVWNGNGGMELWNGIRAECGMG